ncbi:MAG: hypothetical protein MRY49_00250 [Candidatus Pacebacteria bacterium]|nr:hypothetical protein [Candidatus Paceibacterota bacterium]
MKIKPLGFFARVADILMIPVMYLVSGTFRESPQKTHFWNNTKLRKEDTRYLSEEMMICSSGQSQEKARRGILFHLPILGGWRRYVVIRPTDRDVNSWYIGWKCRDLIGVSRIPVKGPVRVLCGPDETLFFGVKRDGTQVGLSRITYGNIGEFSKYSTIPLH